MTEQDPMVGRVVLGRYRIVRPLAKGGMGVVYLARTEGASGFSKPFIVKRMATDILVDANMLKMFVREARVMSRLRHPGLVGVTDFGEESGDYLMVLEYVHGFHLGQWLRYVRQTIGQFPAGLGVHIMCKVLDGLEYAHKLTDSDGRALGIVHRDVSPSNILIDVEGIVKLADFGVARSEEHTEKTEETTIKGKMPYLAPELFRLARPTPATDGYAAAVVLHETIVGRNEFRTGDMASTVSKVLEHHPSRVDALRADIPAGLASVLERALSKDPSERYQSAAELASALRSVRGLPENDADLQLRDLARKDFNDPRMGEALGVISLAERDASWRNAPTTDPPPEASFASNPPTIVQGFKGGASSARSRRRTGGSRVDSGEMVPIEVDLETRFDPPDVPPQSPFRGWTLIGAAAVLGLAAVGVTYAIVGRNPGRTHFVEVTPLQGPTQNVVEEPEDAGGVVVDAGDIEERPSGVDAGSSPAVPARVAPDNIRASVRALNSAIGRNRAEFVGCFSGLGSDSVNLTIRFAVAPTGEVTDASISSTGATANISQTPAGQCVLRVARQTRFPPQPRALTFSIPFTIQPTQR